MKVLLLFLVLVLILLPWAAGLAFFLVGVGTSDAIALTVLGVILSYVLAALLVMMLGDS